MFYDALETNDNAHKVLGNDALRMISRELVATVGANVPAIVVAGVVHCMSATLIIAEVSVPDIKIVGTVTAILQVQPLGCTVFLYLL